MHWNLNELLKNVLHSLAQFSHKATTYAHYKSEVIGTPYGRLWSSHLQISCDNLLVKKESTTDGVYLITGP